MEQAGSTSKGRAAQPLESASNPAALLRLQTVEALTGLKRSALYGRIAAGTFPKQIILSSRCVRWRAGDVSAWLASVGGGAA